VVLFIKLRNHQKVAFSDDPDIPIFYFVFSFITVLVLFSTVYICVIRVHQHVENDDKIDSDDDSSY